MASSLPNRTFRSTGTETIQKGTMDEDTPYAVGTSILPSLGQQDKCDVLENISHLYSCRLREGILIFKK